MVVLTGGGNRRPFARGLGIYELRRQADTIKVALGLQFAERDKSRIDIQKFGGLLAQNRINAGWTVNKVRKFVIGLGGLIMLVSLLMTMKAATPVIAVLLSFEGLAAIMLLGAQVVAVLERTSGDRHLGGVDQ